jgi:hypothetical protein
MPTLQENLYYLFDDPTSSKEAYVLAVFIVSLIILSITAFVAERSTVADHMPPEVWTILETVCTIVFSIEYAIRFYAAPVSGSSRLFFATRVLNVFDLLAILPWYVEKILDLINVSGGSALNILRLVRVARVLRLFKLSRYSTWLQLVGEGMARSLRPVMILMSFFLLSALISASIIYYMEKQEDCRSCLEMLEMDCVRPCTAPEDCEACLASHGISLERTAEPAASFELLGIKDRTGTWADLVDMPERCGKCFDTQLCWPPDCFQFTSIPLAMYWAITTMTTVGYGDYVPQGLPGRILALMTMFVGILLLALPVIVVGGNFQEVYNESERRKMERHMQDVRKSPAEQVLSEWDERVRDLTGIIERTELTSQATTAKARAVLQGLRAAAVRSGADPSLNAVKPGKGTPVAAL